MAWALTLALVGVAVVAGLLWVLYRRRLLMRGGDGWTAGRERRPRVGEVGHTGPHSDGGGSGTAGLGGGGY